MFLGPPHDRISFIYASLGCQHTLQPGDNDYEPPKIPALTLKGFVRWQSIETLLGPDEHVPYLQFAVKNFEIMRADGTTRFPPTLPAECLPSKADDQVMRWHEDCSKRLWEEYITPQPTPRGSPRPRSYTGPPAGTPVENEKYKYAYAHVKVPLGHSFSAQSSPRMRPGDKREREDYFNSKSIPSSRRSRPTTADSGRGGRYEGHRRSSPEEYEDLYGRGRRRSVPKNYYSGLDGSDVPTPGRATSHPASPTERRPHSGSFSASAKEYAGRHSHPRHKHAEVETESSSDEEGEASDPHNSPAPPSPQYSKMRGVKSNLDVGSSAGSAHRLSSDRMSRHNSSKSGMNVPDLRYEAPSPVGTPMSGKSNREARRGTHMIGEMGRVASAYGTSYGRAHSGLDVPTMGRGEKARIYKVHSADEDRGELRHKHSTSTSGGSRSNSRDDLRAPERESRRTGGVRWVKEVIGDALPFGHGSRRHSDSPPNRDRDDVRRGDKYRKEDMDALNRAERQERREKSSDEERRRAKKVREREDALEWQRKRDRERARDLMDGKLRPEVSKRY